MKASIIVLWSASLLAAASPLSPRSGAETPDSVLNNYQKVSDDTVSKLTIFGCEIRECVEALAPFLASCAIAAATEGRDTAKDATCVGNAFSVLAPSKKPAECNHCYK